MDDFATERESTRYRLCGIGFGAIGVALAIASVFSVLYITWMFGNRWVPNGLVREMFRYGEAVIVWSSLVGAYLLWGRWSHPGWQRRAGLLLVMCIIDALLWMVSNATSLGLPVGDVGHEWLRENIGEALGWAEFMLIASLACDMLEHLGVERASDAGQSTRSLAATGSAIWLLWFIMKTQWRHGWPLVAKRGPDINTVLLHLGHRMIWTITLIQTTALVIAATRQSFRLLVELNNQAALDPIFRSRSQDAVDLLPKYADDAAKADRESLR